MKKDIKSEFEQNIRNLTDDELFRIVSVDFNDYEETALEIVRDEIKRRNLTIPKQDQQQDQPTDEDNADESLIQKAISLCPVLLEMIASFTISQIKSFKDDYDIKLEKGKDIELICENAFFYLHLLERDARGCLSEDKSNKFIDVVFLNVLFGLHCEYVTDQRAADFIHHTSKLYQQRFAKYWDCDDPALEPNEAYEGDIYWEYSRIITETVGLEENIDIATNARKNIPFQIAHLNVPDLLRNKQREERNNDVWGGCLRC